MPRNMSFALTTDQIRQRTKTVTRRQGWWHLKPGETISAVEKAMGLKKGEKISRLGYILVTSTRKEPINAIDQDDVIAEGFPDWTPKQFVEFFCDTHKGVTPTSLINRIQFTHVDLYRPSNGTEGECFYGAWCANCTKDTERHPCRIVGATQFLDMDDHNYPWQWQYTTPEEASEIYPGIGKAPICRAFNPVQTVKTRSTSVIHRMDTKTIDMFPAELKA